MESNDDSKNNPELIRLSKLMAVRGICSRREADDYIGRGLVSVNGVVISEMGTKVPVDSRIELGAEALKQQKDLVTIILNKPIGYVSSQPEDGYLPAIQLLEPKNFAGPGRAPFNPRAMDNLAVAGRLDIDSQGLLIFTQDGRIAKKIIGENSEVEKEYLVRVDGILPKAKLELLRHGLVLDGKPLKPAQVEWANSDQLRFILTEGKNRQVRRMCEAVGLFVTGLKRVRVGNLPLGNIPEGQWRFYDEKKDQI